MRENVKSGSRKMITTEDGSHSVFSSEFNCSYHSVNGAVSESMHIFIENGLEYFYSRYKNKTVSILEFGFGTGLNALLAWQWSERKGVNVHYYAIEAYPLLSEEFVLLNYPEIFNIESEKFFKLHNNNIFHDGYFQLEKFIGKFEDFPARQKYDIIFFDPFGPDEQPHLWEQPFLDVLPELIVPKGILVTYSVKGSFRRALKNLGFDIEKLPGPPGKRHVLRSTLGGKD